MIYEHAEILLDGHHLNQPTSATAPDGNDLLFMRRASMLPCHPVSPCMQNLLFGQPMPKRMLLDERILR